MIFHKNTKNHQVSAISALTTFSLSSATRCSKWGDDDENRLFLISFKLKGFFAFARVFEGVGGLIIVYFHVFPKGSAD